MKKKLLLILITLSFFIPFNTYALSDNYKDIIKDIVGVTPNEGKVAIYLFHSNTCPHCREEIKFLDELEEKYDDYIDIYEYEISNSTNTTYMKAAKKLFNISGLSVPFTVIGEDYYSGYSSAVGDRLEIKIREYSELSSGETINEENTFNLPLIGEINAKEASIPLIGMILGLIDGFNPCAMWILLFLINMLFDMKNKKKMFLFGYVFLFTSALVYFLSMLGISFLLDKVQQIKIIIALIAIVAGGLNIKKFITTKEDGCHVVDSKKRKKIFTRINGFINEKNTIIALVGIITLAASVNIVELACSAAFPSIYAEILSINGIMGIEKVLYLILYCIFYMIDDFIVFTIAISTLNIKTSSTKYTKYSGLVGGIIMILMGILLIFKPEWVMLNF